MGQIFAFQMSPVNVVFASRQGHPPPPGANARFHQDPSPKSPAFFHSGEVAYGFDEDFVGV